jgi:hypothetical protein
MIFLKKLLLKIPFFNNIHQKKLERIVLEGHKETEIIWEGITSDYFSGKIAKYEIKPKQNLLDKKIIWQYWGQGLQDAALPEVVKMCFHSVDKYKGDKEVIRLSDETIGDYIDLPDFVYEKLKNNPEFNRVFFSDLLRLALLKVYGGIWLDATIMLTGPLPIQFINSNYFIYQRDDHEPLKTYWQRADVYYWGWRPEFKVRSLNSVIFAQRDNIIIATLLDLILYYWKTKDHVINYFFFQILYNLLVQKRFMGERCLIVSDTIPHLLQAKIKMPNTKFITYDNVVKLGTIHKTRYKYKGKALKRLKIFYEKYV